MNRFLLVLSFTLFSFSALVAQHNHNTHFKIRGGANYNDMNYGTEFLSDFFPTEDYNSFMAGGDAGNSFFVGLGLNHRVSNWFELFSNLDFASLFYDIDGQVAERRVSVTRPLESTVPVSAEGNVRYAFVNMDVGTNFYILPGAFSGLFLSAFLSGNFHMNTAWKVDVVYEDDSTGSSDELPSDEDLDYNNFIPGGGIGIGYNLPLGEHFFLTPLVEIRGGFQSLVADEPAFTTFNMGVEAKFSF